MHTRHTAHPPINCHPLDLQRVADCVLDHNYNKSLDAIHRLHFIREIVLGSVSHLSLDHLLLFSRANQWSRSSKAGGGGGGEQTHRTYKYAGHPFRVRSQCWSAGRAEVVGCWAFWRGASLLVCLVLCCWLVGAHWQCRGCGLFLWVILFKGCGSAPGWSKSDFNLKSVLAHKSARVFSAVSYSA